VATEDGDDGQAVDLLVQGRAVFPVVVLEPEFWQEKSDQAKAS
jgi:hypothetical protein